MSLSKAAITVLGKHQKTVCPPIPGQNVQSCYICLSMQCTYKVCLINVNIQLKIALLHGIFNMSTLIHCTVILIDWQMALYIVHVQSEQLHSPGSWTAHVSEQLHVGFHWRINHKVTSYSVILNGLVLCVVPDCYDRSTDSTAHPYQMMTAAGQNHHPLY